MKFHTILQRLLILIFIFTIVACGAPDEAYNKNGDAAQLSETNWWPEQPIPEGVVIAESGKTNGENALIASLSGLVAKAQKEGEVDELVWIESGAEYVKWYSVLMNRIGAEERGKFDVLALLDRYKDQNIIEGYILYSQETDGSWREDIDLSLTIAASYAGVENAIIIDEALESAIKERGYSLILDAREISRNDYFKDLKDKKNRDLIVTMTPTQFNNIDFAIANNAMVSYGSDEVTDKIMQWLNPMSPVVGWNAGAEDLHTRMASQYGLFNTASDHANNLILLSTGAKSAEYEKVNTLDPKELDFDKEGNFHSFVMSDGDNMQWTIGNFIDNQNYWGNSTHGDFPMGFTSCPVNLSLMAPDVLDELCQTQPENTSVIEYGPGGYQYPDIFGIKRENREEIQRKFAQQINSNMQQTGATVLGFITIDLDSEDAIDAYKIYAEEIDNLTGMLGVQYFPYHGGAGKIIWVKNKEGLDIPVVTARYSLWKGLNYDDRGGDVNKIANAINKDVEGESGVMDWTVVHAWSNFEDPSNSSETASGLNPVKWTIDEMDDEINIVSPEELLWRIRMNYNPEQTKNILSD